MNYGGRDAVDERVDLGIPVCGGGWLRGLSAGYFLGSATPALLLMFGAWSVLGVVVVSRSLCIHFLFCRSNGGFFASFVRFCSSFFSSKAFW